MTEEGNLEMFEVVMRDGAVKIVGAPDPGEPRLHELADFCFNGLQKDPSRDESNWKIVKQLTAASVSYDPDRRLNSHSDQSLPNHGTPALFLLMHYAQVCIRSAPQKTTVIFRYRDTGLTIPYPARRATARTQSWTASRWPKRCGSETRRPSGC